MKVILGLIGQICAGKNQVAAAFRSNGAMIWDADKAVHNLYLQPKIKQDIIRLFPQLDGDSEIDRKKLASIVFADPKELEKLTSYLYTHTGKLLEEVIKVFKRSTSTLLVLNAPTMVESGRIDVCDKVLFVEAPLKSRIKWAKQRGWKKEQLLLRESRMAPEDKKRELSFSILSNDGSLEELDEKVTDLFKTLTKE